MIDLCEDLDDLLQKEKSKDLYNNKEDVLDLIISEISSRYFYQKGRIEANLLNDKQINKANFILSNINEYNSIFEPVD